MSFALNGWNAQAVNVIATDYRLDAADDNFADSWKITVVFKVRPRRRLRAKRIELATGTLSTSQENRIIVSSLGPVKRPLVAHEQNVVTDSTNRLLARFARVVLQAFPGNFPGNLKTKTVASATSIPLSTLSASTSPHRSQ